jgi:hypothetical protein
MPIETDNRTKGQNISVTMSIPSTVITGTIAYLVLGVFLLGTVFSMRSVGKLSKDDAA